MKSPPNRLILFSAILIAILAVSTASILIKAAQQEVPSIVISAMRLAFSLVIITPIVLTNNLTDLKSLSRSDWIMGMASGIFLAIHFYSWITSLEYTSITSSVVLVSTGPLWVALLSPIVLKEPFSLKLLGGLLLATIGGVVIALGNLCVWESGLMCNDFSELFQSSVLLGNILAIVGAIAVSGYLLIGRKLRKKLSLFPYIFISYGTAALILLAVIAVRRVSLIGYSVQSYGWLILLALIPQLLGHSTYNWALRYMSATMVAIGTLGEPIGSTILAFIILSQSPSIYELGGGILILSGLLLAIYSPTETGT